MGRIIVYIIIGIIVIAAIVILIQNSNTPSQQILFPTPSQPPSSSQPSGTPQASAAPSSPQQSGIVSLTVTGSNFKFDPNEIRVHQGDTVVITFVNVGGMHNLNLDEFNVHTDTLPGGEQQTVQFIASKKGTFEYYCSVSNHRQMGMVGSLIVE